MEDTFNNIIDAINNLKKKELTPEVMLAWSKVEELTNYINNTQTPQNHEPITHDDATLMVNHVIPALIANRMLKYS